MIKQLKLSNYILIDNLTLTFDNGMNVITGETGAGKSIIINAIDMVFAPRVSKDVIKNGTEKAVIELTLDNQNHNLYAFFNENGIDDWGSEVVITREITHNSIRAKINGSLVGSDTLATLRNIFVDFHSQHQTYSYLQPKFHIELLDSYGKNSYGHLLVEYKSIYKEYCKMLSDFDKLKESANMSEQQLEFLKFQISEIENAQIKSENEDIELKNELEVLQNAEKLKELTASSYWALNGDDGSVLDCLNKIKANISKAMSIDDNLAELSQNFNNIIENVKDSASELNNYSQKLSMDAQRLDEIQERLFLLDKLKRKYGNSIANVLNTYNKLSTELSSFDTSTQNLTDLQNQITEIENKLCDIANKISDERKHFAQLLSEEICKKLEVLELPKSKFVINVTTQKLSENGIDNVEFMISTNVSEDVKPLAKVASGGEISRVMLAIKSIFAQNDNIDTVIFDEIDTGISGKTSQSVADEIVNLAKYHQIILITHQAIIASKADRHIFVKKSQDNETTVQVCVLSDDDKIKALAQLAGGDINQQALDFAKSLIGSNN